MKTVKARRLVGQRAFYVQKRTEFKNLIDL